jgi:hypothetical protein
MSKETEQETYNRCLNTIIEDKEIIFESISFESAKLYLKERNKVIAPTDLETDKEISKLNGSHTEYEYLFAHGAEWMRKIFTGE